MCGLEISVSGERVTGIRPDHDDVWSRGYICPKGAVLGDLHADPDRLRAPLVRRGDTWVTATWDEAFAVAAERLRAVIARHGLSAVGTYIGNPDRPQLLVVALHRRLHRVLGDSAHLLGAAPSTSGRRTWRAP